MKRILALIVLCSLGAALQAQTEKKTKYICTIGGPVRNISEEFKTREECEDACIRAGVPAVCEETGADTEVRTGVDL